MTKYFHNAETDEIRSDEIFSLFRRSNRRTNELYRIEMTDECMRLSKPTKYDCIEFEILEACLIFEGKDGYRERYDWDASRLDSYFMAVIHPQMFMVYTLKTADQYREGKMMFEKNETFLGMFRTATSTIFITYDGEMDHFGYGYYLEYGGYPSVYRLITSAMNTKWETTPPAVDE